MLTLEQSAVAGDWLILDGPSVDLVATSYQSALDGGHVAVPMITMWTKEGLSRKHCGRHLHNSALFREMPFCVLDFLTILLIIGK